MLHSAKAHFLITWTLAGIITCSIWVSANHASPICWRSAGSITCFTALRAQSDLSPTVMRLEGRMIVSLPKHLLSRSWHSLCTYAVLRFQQHVKAYSPMARTDIGIVTILIRVLEKQLAPMDCSLAFSFTSPRLSQFRKADAPMLRSFVGASKDSIPLL